MTEKLLTVSEAIARILSRLQLKESIQIHIDQAIGRVLAQDVYAGFDLPQFSNASMDGFAVNSEDVSTAGLPHPIELNVVGDLPAGNTSEQRILQGECIRVMTGAPIPDGCDAVVPVEWTDFDHQHVGVSAPACVHIFQSVKSGDHIRPRGQDMHLGEMVLQRGTLLRPQEIGLLAMLGIKSVDVFQLPRVGILSTGNELIPVGSELTSGKIYDSNITMLAAQIVQSGGVPISLGVAADTSLAVRTLFDRAVSEQVDLILSSAGVSVGAFDFVRSVIVEHGKLDFWKVNMRPGKPLAFGEYRGIPFIGLPGNPVSSFIGFEVFVRPAVNRMAGRRNVDRLTITVKLAESIQSDGRESYLRAIVEKHEGIYYAYLTGHQGSGNLRSLVQANAILIVPSEVKSLPSGVDLEAWLFGW